MSEAFETINYRGYKIELIQEQYPFHPREDSDPLGTFFVPRDNRNISGDKGAIDPNDLEDREIAVLVLVYALVHSGVWLNTTGFSDPWDSGCVGAIYLTREDVLKEFGWKVLTKTRKEKLESYLRSEIQTLSDYFEGNVAGYVITDPNDEQLDSCWGYYPDHETDLPYRNNNGWQSLIEECKSIVDHQANKLESFASVGIGL